MLLKPFKIFITFFAPVLFLLQNGSYHLGYQLKEVKHKVQINHPGKTEGTIEYQTLVEIKDKNNIAIEYYMDVESVICLKKVCKIVAVKIYWNAIGEFKRYELAEGVQLEKYKYDYFDVADYPKLQKILAQRDSPFKDVKLSEILVSPAVNHNDVDAVSGATAIVLSDEQTVKGAALTCYTLWHWANGEVVEIIRNITANSLKTKDFETFLKSKNENYKVFALEQMTNNKFYSKALVDVVISNISNKNLLFKKAIKYLEITSSELYLNSMKSLFIDGGEKKRIEVLSSLINTKNTLSSKYLDGFSESISKLKTYQEVFLFLKLMENKNSNSKKIIAATIPLLKRELVTARRTYWFLENQKLDKNQKRIVNKFYKKYKEQL